MAGTEKAEEKDDGKWPKVFIRTDRGQPKSQPKPAYFGDVDGALEYVAKRGFPCAADKQPIEHLEGLGQKLSVWPPVILQNAMQAKGHAFMEEKWNSGTYECSMDFFEEGYEEVKGNADFMLGFLKSWVCLEEDENNGGGPFRFSSEELLNSKPYVLEVCRAWPSNLNVFEVLNFKDSQLVADKGFLLEVLQIPEYLSVCGGEDFLEYVPDDIQSDLELLAAIRSADPHCDV